MRRRKRSQQKGENSQTSSNFCVSKRTRLSNSQMKEMNESEWESQICEVLAHLHSQHRERLSPNRLTLFARYLDHNATAAGVFLRLPGHEQQLYYIENLDLDAYKDPWPRN